MSNNTMSDTLSKQHFDVVKTEIMGRFFSLAEAHELIDMVIDRILTDPLLREAAAKCWPEVKP